MTAPSTMRRYEQVALLLQSGMQPVDICHKLHITRNAFREHRKAAVKHGILDYQMQQQGRPRSSERPSPAIVETSEQMAQWPEGMAFVDVKLKPAPLKFYHAEVPSWSSSGDKWI